MSVLGDFAEIGSLGDRMGSDDGSMAWTKPDILGPALFLLERIAICSNGIPRVPPFLLLAIKVAFLRYNGAA